MRTERVIGYHRARDKVGTAIDRFDPCVEMLPEIAEWPAVKGAVAHTGHIVRDKIAAQFVAFVDRSPQHTGHRFKAQPVGIAQASAIFAMRTGAGIDLPYRGTSSLGRKPVFADVAVRSHRHEQCGAIGIGDQVLRPVMVDRSSRQIDDLARRRGDGSLTRDIGKRQHGIGVGHV